MPWRELEKYPGASSPDVYRAVIEGAPTMLWLGDAQGKCVFLNRMLRAFWGVTMDEIQTFDWTSTIHPDDLDRLAGPFGKAMSEQSPMEVEARYRRADGVYRVLRTSAQPRFSASGEFIGMVGVNTDITEQRESEENLRQAVQSLALATNASRLGWGMWDMGSGTVHWDSRGREILGLEEHEATTEAWFHRILPEDLATVRRELEDCVADHRTFDMLFRVRNSRGELVRVHATGIVQRTDSGVIGTGLVRDITEQAREEEFQQLVIQELGHRIKNLLGLVNSLVSQTGGTGSEAEYKTKLLGRLRALSATVSSAQYGSNESSDIHDLCRAVLGPHLLGRPDAIRIEGPSCRLSERHGRLLGLALHELATNAVKYGALTGSDGHVDLGWSICEGAGAPQLELTWTERGGPEVIPPKEKGFGSRLLLDVVRMEADATSQIEYHTLGVKFVLCLANVERALQPEPT